MHIYIYIKYVIYFHNPTNSDFFQNLFLLIEKIFTEFISAIRSYQTKFAEFNFAT